MARRPFEVNSVLSPISGFIGAVFGSALWGSLAFAALALVDFPFHPGSLIAAMGFFLLAVIVSVVVVPIVALFIGLPFGCLLAAFRWESAVTYTIGGAALGLIPLLAGTSDDLEWAIKASFGVYGGVCGYLWWRLDRSARQPESEN